MMKFKNGFYGNAFPVVKNGTNKGKIDRINMVGMNLFGQYKGVDFDNLLISEYIGKFKEDNSHPKFKVKYKDDAEIIINCNSLINGKIGSVLNVDTYTFMDCNNKFIDENGVVIINIKNRKGEEFTALYRGDHVEEVLSNNWYVITDKSGKALGVKSGNYNRTGKLIGLHQVDLGSWVDHINNDPLDNRIENLRKSNQQHNSKNKKSNGKTEITGLKNRGKGWVGCYLDAKSKVVICTKTKRDFEEAKIDCLIAQRYMGYRHNEDLFYSLDDLPIERIKQVEDLLEGKIKIARSKSHEEKEYNHDIEECDGYYKLKKNGKEMLFDCDLEFIKCKSIDNIRDYWSCRFVESGNRIQNKFHKELLNLRANEYKEYNIQIDHLNGNSSDNRYENLAITTHYSNICNKQGAGYTRIKSGSFQVKYMEKYKYWDFIKGIRSPTYKTEEEAIIEVSRRRGIIELNRVKLKSKQELDELIEYCLDNKYILGNGLADLDLGYLYWKGIFSL